MVDKYIPSYLINSHSFAVVITDLAGNYTYVNPLFENSYNINDGDIIGRPFKLTIHPEDVELCNNAANNCINYPGKVFKIQVRKPDYSTNDFYLTNWEFSLLCNNENEPIGILCIGSDLTEVGRVNLKAKVFSEELEKLVDEITDGFYVLNDQWEFIKINTEAEKIFKKSKKELLGTNFWDILPESSNSKFSANFKLAMYEYKTISFEEYISTLDLWFYIICYPSHEGITVFFKDISEEKNTQRQLENSRYKLKAILDSTTESNILISPDYKILCYNKQANDSCIAFFGKSMSEFDDMWDFVLPNDKEEFYNDTQKALKGEYLNFEKELIFENYTCWYQVSYFPVLKYDGSVLGVTFNIANIDLRKKSELKIQESEVMLKSLYNSSNEALVFLDRDFKVQFINDQAQEISRNFHNKIISNGDMLLNYYCEELRAEFKCCFENTLKGEEFFIEKKLLNSWWNFSIFPVYDSEDNIVGISQIIKNITVQKKYELKIESQNEKLKAIAWQQNHKVRGPLSNILGLCELVVLNSDVKSLETRQYLQHIMQSSKDLDHIIQTIVKQTTEL